MAYSVNLGIYSLLGHITLETLICMSIGHHPPESLVT